MKTHIDFRVVAEEFFRAFPKSNIYFLLDQSGLPGLCQQLSRGSAAWINLFNRTTEASALAVAPILVLVGSNGDSHATQRLFNWIAEKGTYTSTVTVLSSPLPMDLMAERLKNRLGVRISENMEAMLRFFDPRILESLERILTIEQSAAFFGTAEAWRYVDRTGKLKRIDSEFHIVDRLPTPLTFTQKQEFDLIDASEIDQVLDLVRTNVPSAMADRPLCEQYDFIKHEVEIAKRHGFDSVLKYAFYIVVPVLEGEDFVGSAEWENFLDKVKNNDFDFLEKFAAIN